MDGSDNPNGAAPHCELVEVIREIRERVRARHPSGSASGLPLPDLQPIVHARDAASAKVASIGTVNPRPPGVLNSAIQALKKLLARALDWHVREQVEFNRAAMTSVEAILEALNENNRALARLAAGQAELLKEIERLAHLGQEASRRIDKLEADQAQIAAGVAPLREEARELKDVRLHWAQWRQEWEHKVSVNEVQFLRGIADLQAAFAHRATLMENNFREMVHGQHEDYLGALDRSTIDIQKRLWTDLEKVRAEFERLIFTELCLIRQRLALPVTEPAAATLAAPASAPTLDYARFAERFRGSPEFIREKQKFYLPYFQGRREVLDLGCGRGEFFELMQEAGVEARGIDASEESAALCRQKGLRAEAADLFEYLQSVPERTLDGIFCSQVVVAPRARTSAGDDPPLRLAPRSWRSARCRDTQPQLPGDLRHLFLS